MSTPTHDSFSDAVRIIKSKEIAEIVDQVFDGVNQSEVGPIKQEPTQMQKDQGAKYAIDNLAMQTFIVVLNNIFPKTMEAKMEMADDE
jgi:hypothetical protein